MELNFITEYSTEVKKQWSEFVKSHPQGTAFQGPEMYELFLQTEYFKPIFILACKPDQFLAGVVLAVEIREYRGLIGKFSARTVVYGGPLIHPESGNREEVLDQLLKELIRKVSKKTVFIQLRNFFNWDAFRHVFENNGFRFRERLNFIVDTKDEQALKGRVSKSKLRQIRQSFDAGVRIIVPEKIEQVEEFYYILYDLYRKKVRKPLPKWSFFSSFFYAMQKGELGVILLVKYENRIIGGVLCPVFADRVIYEWYICGLDREFDKIYPSVMATWAPIEYALKNNIVAFDFMGVGTPRQKYGVREFKSKFGGRLVNYGRWTRINNSWIYSISELFYNLLTVFRKV